MKKFMCSIFMLFIVYNSFAKGDTLNIKYNYRKIMSKVQTYSWSAKDIEDFPILAQKGLVARFEYEDKNYVVKADSASLGTIVITLFKEANDKKEICMSFAILKDHITHPKGELKDEGEINNILRKIFAIL